MNIPRAGKNGRGKTKARTRVSPWKAQVLATVGFTLLEVMITLTLLGFILLIVFSAFRLGLSAWQRGETTREEFQNLRAVTQLVSRQLKSIFPYKIKTQKAEGDYLAFEGKLHSVKFISALPIRGKQVEGFVFVVYEFEGEGQEGGRLVLYEQRVLNKDFFEETPKEESGISLLERVSDVRFEYYREESTEKNQTAGWVDEWNAKDEKVLPKAMRVTITRKNGKNEKEEVPITLLASIPANQFEEVRAGLPGLGRRAVRERIQRQQ